MDIAVGADPDRLLDPVLEQWEVVGRAVGTYHLQEKVKNDEGGKKVKGSCVKGSGVQAQSAEYHALVNESVSRQPRMQGLNQATATSSKLLFLWWLHSYTTA